MNTRSYGCVVHQVSKSMKNGSPNFVGASRRSKAIVYTAARQEDNEKAYRFGSKHCTKFFSLV
jgi:hypothetical protein